MVLWKRVSPGMLPDTSSTPLSTYAELHAAPQQTEGLDTTHHLKRTDFAGARAVRGERPSKAQGEGVCRAVGVNRVLLATNCIAEYTEAKLRHHMHIKAAATRP